MVESTTRQALAIAQIEVVVERERRRYHMSHANRERDEAGKEMEPERAEPEACPAIGKRAAHAVAQQRCGIRESHLVVELVDPDAGDEEHRGLLSQCDRNEPEPAIPLQPIRLVHVRSQQRLRHPARINDEQAVGL